MPARVLLVQIRSLPAVLAEERLSVATRAGLPVDAVETVNALSEPLGPARLENVGALMIGGAGAYSAANTYPWTDALVGLCHAAAEREMPTFGLCWGHQFLARAFGGEVAYDPERAESGTHDVELTDAGRADPLFAGVPDRFPTQMGHHDRVRVLPPGAVELARNDTAPFQAIRFARAPIYGTQFHPELDVDAERVRLVAYRAHYPENGDDAAFEALLASLRPTPHADALLRRFVELYVA